MMIDDIDKYLKMYDEKVPTLGFIGAFDSLLSEGLSVLDRDTYHDLRYQFTPHVISKMICESADVDDFEIMLGKIKDLRFTSIYHYFFHAMYNPSGTQHIDRDGNIYSHRALEQLFFNSFKEGNITYPCFDKYNFKYLVALLKCVDGVDIANFHESRFVRRVLDIYVADSVEVDPLIKIILLEVEKNPIFTQNGDGKYRTFFDSMMIDLTTDLSANALGNSLLKKKYIDYFEDIYPDFKERLLNLMISVPSGKYNVESSFISELKIRYGVRDWVDYLGFKNVVDKINVYVNGLYEKSSELEKYENMGLSSSILVSFDKYNFKDVVWDEIFAPVDSPNFTVKSTVAVYFLSAFLNGNGNQLNMSKELAQKIQSVLTDSFVTHMQDKSKIYINSDIIFKLTSLLEQKMINSADAISLSSNKNIRQKM